MASTFGVGGALRRGRRGSVQFKVEGLREVFNRLGRFPKGVQTQLREALNDEANNILGASKKLVPVDTARLKESGRVIKPRRTATKTIEFTVIYGGIKVRGIFVDYAETVHERTEIRHRVGQAKYLSTAFNKFLPGMAARIRSKVDIDKIK